MNTLGIVERIKQAETEQQVRELESEVKGYEEASPKTLRRAFKAARVRRAQLGTRIGKI